MSETLDSIHHVAIVAKNIRESVTYYTKTFVCDVLYEDATWALLKFANLRIALVTPGQHPPHLGIPREDAEAWGKLKKHRDGSESLYIADPSGNAVEILKTSTLPF